MDSIINIANTTIKKYGEVHEYMNMCVSTKLSRPLIETVNTPYYVLVTS